MNLKKLVWLFGLLLCLSIVQAATYQVKSINLPSCSCEIISNPIIIENTALTTEVFLVQQEGSAAKWATLFPEIVILKPGEVVELNNLINVPCDISGEFELKTKVSSSVLEEFTQTVAVNKCPNFELTAVSLENQGCGCTPFVYEFWLKNTGSFEESYKFDVSEFSEFTALTTNPILLVPGDTEHVYLYITPPCDILGNFTTTAIITSEKTQFKAQAPLKLNIEDCNIITNITANFTGNVTGNETTTGISKGFQIMLALSAFMGFVLLMVLIIVLVVSGNKQRYYKPIKLKEPKIPKPPKIKNGEDNIIKKILLVMAIIAIVILIFFLYYKAIMLVVSFVSGGFSLFTPQLNQTNLTNNTINNTANLTYDFQNQTLNETNQTQNELYDESQSMLSSVKSKAVSVFAGIKDFFAMYTIYFFAGFVILAVLILVLTLIKKHN